jgi:hypothetical protein
MIYKNSGERLRDAIERKPRTMEKIDCGHCGLPTLARDMDLESRICFACIDFDEAKKSAAEMYILAH